MADRLRVFVLEDDPARIGFFWKIFENQPVELTVSTTVEDALKAFQDRDDWGLVSLDHDLGGQTFVDSADPTTGAAFVRQMAAKIAHAKVVAVHSYNQAGAMRMIAALADVGIDVPWTPFGSSMHLSRIAEAING